MERLIAKYPIYHRAEVAKLVTLAEREHDHKTGIKPYTFHHDIVGNKIADEFFLPFQCFDINLIFRHTFEITHDECLFSFHRRYIEMDVVNFVTIEGESFQSVLEGDTMIRFFPHLFGQIEATLWTFKIWIYAKGEYAIYNKFSGVEEGHDKFDCMTFVFSHLGPIVEVFFESNFVLEPSIAHRLIIEIISPLISDGVKIDVFW